jgi:hypothetical protein
MHTLHFIQHMMTFIAVDLEIKAVGLAHNFYSIG